MKVCLAACHAEHITYMDVLVPWLRAKGHEVVRCESTPSYNNLPQADVHILWNGSGRTGQPGPQLIFAEVGWFPGAPTPRSAECIYLDRQGINAGSELRGYVPVDSPADAESRVRSFLHGRGWDRGPSRSVYSLVVLQMEDDTNVQSYARGYTNMQDFIQICERSIEGRILVKRHPRDEQTYKTRRSTLVKGGDIWPLLAGAAQVVGINSTCLLQAFALGKPVMAYGDTIFDHVVGASASKRFAFLHELIFRRQINLRESRDSLDRNRVLQEVFA